MMKKTITDSDSLSPVSSSPSSANTTDNRSPAAPATRFSIPTPATTHSMNRF
ncbi:hypothetical protein Hanom_Chr16g01510481 [Helianthus anomalus]